MFKTVDQSCVAFRLHERIAFKEKRRKRNRKLPTAGGRIWSSTSTIQNSLKSKVKR